MTWRQALEHARASGDLALRDRVVAAARFDGVSVRAIAGLLDVSTSTVQRWAGGPTGQRSRPLDAPCPLSPNALNPREASAA